MHDSIMDVDCVAALSLPSAMTESAKVASATEGAAPNNPAKLFGLKRSPSSANVETDIPPIKKRMRISFIVPGQETTVTRPLSLSPPSVSSYFRDSSTGHLQARRAWTKIAAQELFTAPRCGAECRRIQRLPDHGIHRPEV
jgi:hypothetical protein